MKPINQRSPSTTTEIEEVRFTLANSFSRMRLRNMLEDERTTSIMNILIEDELERREKLLHNQ